MLGGRLAHQRPAATDAFMLLDSERLSMTITRVLVCNVSDAAAAFDLYHLGATGTPSDADALFKDLEVAAGETYMTPDAPLGFMEKGDRLFARTSVADTLTITVYGTTDSAPSATLRTRGV